MPAVPLGAPVGGTTTSEFNKLNSVGVFQCKWWVWTWAPTAWVIQHAVKVKKSSDFIFIWIYRNLCPTLMLSLSRSHSIWLWLPLTVVKGSLSVCVCVCVCQPHRPKWRQLSCSAVQTRTILVEILHKCFSQYREIALPSSGPCRDLFEIQVWLTAALRELWTEFTILTAIIKHTSVCSDSLCVKSFHITNGITRWFTATHMHLWYISMYSTFAAVDEQESLNMAGN